MYQTTKDFFFSGIDWGKINWYNRSTYRTLAFTDNHGVKYILIFQDLQSISVKNIIIYQAKFWQGKKSREKLERERLKRCSPAVKVIKHFRVSI